MKTPSGFPHCHSPLKEKNEDVLMEQCSLAPCSFFFPPPIVSLRSNLNLFCFSFLWFLLPSPFLPSELTRVRALYILPFNVPFRDMPSKGHCFLAVFLKTSLNSRSFICLRRTSLLYGQYYLYRSIYSCKFTKNAIYSPPFDYIHKSAQPEYSFPEDGGSDSLRNNLRC